MIKINHWCKVCGKGYYACDSCDKRTSGYGAAWRSVACSPVHYQVYLVMHEYTSRRKTKEEASEMLNYCLEENEWREFLPQCQKIIKEIYSGKV